MAVGRSVLFYRDFKGLTGGHLKVKDYYDHLKSSELYEPKMYVTPESRADHLWRSEPLASEYEPMGADVIFIAGLDWTALAPWKRIEERIPVVNLIQHVRHAVLGDPRRGFLSRRAARICVSEEVAEALRQTDKCNGPIYTVPNGVDLGVAFNHPEPKHISDVFIAGVKRPEIAKKLAGMLRRRGLRVNCITNQIERESFLGFMAGTRIVVTLPRPSEGFYLPALEAMKLGKVLICPDAVGNRGFCIDRVTALMPQPWPEALVDSVGELLGDPILEQTLIRSARQIASTYTIEQERSAFLKIMDTIE